VRYQIFYITLHMSYIHLLTYHCLSFEAVTS